MFGWVVLIVLAELGFMFRWLYMEPIEWDLKGCVALVIWETCEACVWLGAEALNIAGVVWEVMVAYVCVLTSIVEDDALAWELVFDTKVAWVDDVDTLWEELKFIACFCVTFGTWPLFWP